LITAFCLQSSEGPSPFFRGGEAVAPNQAASAFWLDTAAPVEKVSRSAQISDGGASL